MKNKILSLIMAVVLIAVQLVIPVAVSADEIPAPVFTLDLSEYTHETQTIKNGVTDSADGITVLEKTAGVAPNVKTYYNASGDKIFSFETANDDATKAETGVDVLGAIKIDAATINDFLGANSDKEMTVTYWANTHRTGNESRFNYAVDGKEGGSINTYNTGSYDEFKVAGQGTNGKGFGYVNSSSVGVWKFFAVSKKWTESETTPGSGKWTYTMFFGDTVKTGTTNEIAYTDPSAMQMFIGARGTNFSASGQYPFLGEIAGFKVYNSALTQDQLTSLKTAENYSALTAEADMPQTELLKMFLYQPIHLRLNLITL